MDLEPTRARNETRPVRSRLHDTDENFVGALALSTLFGAVIQELTQDMPDGRDRVSEIMARRGRDVYDAALIKRIARRLQLTEDARRQIIRRSLAGAQRVLFPEEQR